MFKKALLPVDLSQTTDEIVNRVQFNNHLGTQFLHLMHVQSEGLGHTDHANHKLKNLAIILHSLGYGVTTEVKEGFPPIEICETASAKNVDFVFIPWRRKSRMYRTLLGSTAKDVVRLSDKPVLVCKYHFQAKNTESLESILYPTDFGEAAERAIPYVKALGNQASRTILLHVGDRAADPVSEDKRQNEVLQRLKELEQVLSFGSDCVQKHQTIGIPYMHILKQAEENMVQLIVMGRFNDHPLYKIMGTTAVQVADKSPCSLLVVP